MMTLMNMMIVVNFVNCFSEHANCIYIFSSTNHYQVKMAMQMREYAAHADYAHICEYADADENLIHIIHI